MNNYMLAFFCDLSPSNKLLQGRMILTKNAELVDVYIATSGSPGWQDRDNVRDKGKGPIPATWDAQIKNWSVETKGINMANTKGVEGMFYPIKPFTITIQGVQRGDFGIHADANVPGSAGCIVLPPKNNGWKVFRERMVEIASLGISSIPLQVVYC